MAWDWDKIFKTTGTILESIAFTREIQRWLDESDRDAFNEIEKYIKRSPIELIDKMDTALLNMAQSQFDLELRRRLIKFYAFFKIVEFNNYGFRGFPA